MVVVWEVENIMVSFWKKTSKRYVYIYIKKIIIIILIMIIMIIINNNIGGPSVHHHINCPSFADFM